MSSVSNDKLLTANKPEQTSRYQPGYYVLGFSTVLSLYHLFQKATLPRNPEGLETRSYKEIKERSYVRILIGFIPGLNLILLAYDAFKKEKTAPIAQDSNIYDFDDQHSEGANKPITITPVDLNSDDVVKAAEAFAKRQRLLHNYADVNSPSPNFKIEEESLLYDKEELVIEVLEGNQEEAEEVEEPSPRSLNTRVISQEGDFATSPKMLRLFGHPPMVKRQSSPPVEILREETMVEEQLEEQPSFEDPNYITNRMNFHLHRYVFADSDESFSPMSSLNTVLKRSLTVDSFIAKEALSVESPDNDEEILSPDDELNNADISDERVLEIIQETYDSDVEESDSEDSNDDEMRVDSQSPDSPISQIN